MKRPTRSSASSCRRALLVGALLAFCVQACGQPPAPAVEPEPPPAPEPVMASLLPEPVPELPPAPEPGFEEGFLHCCGNGRYAMQIDCRDRLLRCYEVEGDGFKQTYGRHCRRQLEPSCYLEGCLDVCE